MNEVVVDNAGQNQDHLELGWILNCLTSVGRLSRMTTWKSCLAASRNADESNVDESLLNAGLLTYPSLQAADILIYRYALSCSFFVLDSHCSFVQRATHVPVGEDQTQHLELTRDLAESFNRTFKSENPLFPIPTLVDSASSRSFWFISTSSQY